MNEQNEEDNDDLDDLNLSEDDLFTEEETQENSLFTEEGTEEESDLFEESEAAITEEEPSPPLQQKLISPEQIPLTLKVEAGKIQLTMDQLLKLEPGNLLEINIHPKDGVDLMINGKVVGRGELIRIGEILGVRVLQLGNSAVS